MTDSVDKSGRWPYLTQLSINYLGWALCWTITSAYMVPNALLGMVDDSVKNSRLGLMTGLGNVMVIILIPLFGALSDRTRSRFGRRRPFYLPAAFAMLLLAILIAISNQYLFLLAIVILAHGMLALWFPNRALIRDVVPIERRGRISGLGNIANTLGIMGGHIVAPKFINTGRMMILALIAGAAAVAANLWVALRIKERPPENTADKGPLSFREVYIPKLEKSNGLGWLAAVNLVSHLGLVGMTCFLLYFIKDQIDPENFNGTYANVVLIAMAAAVLSSISAGFVADRFGRRRVFMIACLIQVTAMLNFLLAPRVHTTLYLSGLLYGLGNGAYLSMYWTLLSDLVPEDEASRYIGLMQYTMQIPWAFMPALLGPIVDGFGAESGRGYNVLFTIITVFLVIGAAMIWKIPETLKKNSEEVAL
jgi:MFS family permease